MGQTLIGDYLHQWKVGSGDAQEVAGTLGHRWFPEGRADVFALKEIGVEDSIGIFKKALKPLVISGQGFKQPFKNSTFDFMFSCGSMIEKSVKFADFAMEISLDPKTRRLLVVHMGTRDNYSLNSFLDLFHFCKLLKTRDIDGIDSKMPFIREIVMKKVSGL
ncbi:methyltransferase [Forsythia ovata]|uniref:Methyltransferase n=1 Tax=Forsythia ovata TaxID=205694 RepID=A0ABD1V066_9LAMI